MKSGLYALISLDGSPLGEAESRILGLGEAPPDTAFLKQTGLQVRLRDDFESPQSGFATGGGATMAFLGYLDAAEDLADALNVARETPAPLVALLAFQRWGEDAWKRLAGEWSALVYENGKRLATLAVSPRLRDHVYFASDGRRVAVAPSLALLSHIPWAGPEFDPLGVALSSSRWVFRRTLAGRTLLKNVRTVEWGHWQRIGAQGQKHAHYDAYRPAPSWRGSFEEAVSAFEAAARQSVRRHLRRYPGAAITLSGGLDSSLVALLATQERAPGQKLFAVSSALPAGHAIADERPHIDYVSRTLGLPVTFVTPPDNPDIYVPPASIFAQQERALVGPRHYLYQALFDTARQGGANVVLDGAFGEYSVSRTADLMTPIGLVRMAVRQLRGMPVEQGKIWPDGGSHVYPSERAISVLRAGFGDRQHRLPRQPGLLWPGRPLGIANGVLKAGKWESNTTGIELRHVLPLLDRTMIELSGAMPARFLHATGMPRSFVRAMLRRDLPQIAQRRDKLPFSADFYERMSRHARQMRDRISLHRASGADEWVDLGKLDTMLAQIETTKIASREMLRIQYTANAAEFYTWWKSETGRPAS